MTAVLVTCLCVFIYMTVYFFIAMRIKNNGIVDIAWGGGFIPWFPRK